MNLAAINILYSATSRFLTIILAHLQTLCLLHPHMYEIYAVPVKLKLLISTNSQQLKGNLVSDCLKFLLLFSVWHRLKIKSVPVSFTPTFVIEMRFRTKLSSIDLAHTHLPALATVLLRYCCAVQSKCYSCSREPALIIFSYKSEMNA